MTKVLSILPQQFACRVPAFLPVALCVNALEPISLFLGVHSMIFPVLLGRFAATVIRYSRAKDTGELRVKVKFDENSNDKFDKHFAVGSSDLRPYAVSLGVLYW